MRRAVVRVSSRSARVVYLLALQLARRTAPGIATCVSYCLHRNSRVVQLLALQLACRTAPCLATRVSYSSLRCNSRVVQLLALQLGHISPTPAAWANSCGRRCNCQLFSTGFCRFPPSQEPRGLAANLARPA